MSSNVNGTVAIVTLTAVILGWLIWQQTFVTNVNSKLDVVTMSTNFDFIHIDEEGDVGDQDPWILCSNKPPSDGRFWPTVGNGHLGTVVHSNTTFVNGVYNGNGTHSRRARIPAVTSINITGVSQIVRSKRYCLHLKTGIYTEYYIGDNWSVELSVYAHRTLSRLLVTKLRIQTDGQLGDFHVNITTNAGRPSKDIMFFNQTSGIQNTSYMHGKTNVPETSTSARVSVHVYYTDVPHTLYIQGGVIRNDSHIYLASISPFKDEAKHYYITGLAMHTNGTLENTHVQAWHNIWEEGRIDVMGNAYLASATYSAMYYILSSLPTIPETTWPFVGLSPGDIGHGNSDEGYGGHVFWDQDTWMFPPVLALHSDIGKTLVSTRLRTLDTAREYAEWRGYKGAMYPWETAFTGLNVCPGEDYSKYEIHVTGDVAFAFQQYLMMTRDKSSLQTGSLMDAILNIADFWMSRVTFNQPHGVYEILDVMPPDEWNYPVNNSVYTNSVARLSLLLPEYAAGILGVMAPTKYRHVADNIYIPCDKERQFHPEFDGFNNNITVKQADAILLGFPLMVNMTDTQRRNDLIIYGKVTPSGPAMTWGMFCIGWLEVGQPDRAYKFFMKQLVNKQAPFNVWAEYEDGSGATNFITGQGGFLQSLLFGYAGLRIYKDHITIQCQHIPNTEGFKIKHLDYVDNSIDVTCNITTTCLTLVEQNGASMHVQTDDRVHEFDLQLNITLCVTRQKLKITTSSSF